MASDLADQTPDTGDGALERFGWIVWPYGEGRKQIGLCFDTSSPDVVFEVSAERAAVLDAILSKGATLRQSLTEAEASHQAEIGRLRAELDQARADLVTESRRIRDAAAYERDDAVRAHAAAVGTAQIWEHSATRAHARIADLEHTITQYLDSYGTAGTGVLGKRLKAAVGRVE